MTYDDIIWHVNKKADDERWIESDIITSYNEVMSDVNYYLNATYPFLDYKDYDGSTEFDYLPDDYVYKVIIPGIVVKRFESDNDGDSTPMTWKQDYQRALYDLQRDYIGQVPEEYQLDYGGNFTVADSEVDYDNLGDAYDI